MPQPKKSAPIQPGPSGDPAVHEQPEDRQSDEQIEQITRTVAGVLGAGWPMGSNGKPMALMVGGCSDKVPTVQYGNVVVGPVQMFRFVDDLGRQERVDALRETQRDTEFVVGIERRLLQWAVDPAARVQSPITAADAFAAPPAGYDPTPAADPRVATTPPPAPPTPQAPPVPAPAPSTPTATAG